MTDNPKINYQPPNGGLVIPPENPKVSLAERPLPLQLWTVAFMAWMTFGFSTILNALALLPLNSGYQRGGVVNLPANMNETIWLVLGIWLSGYFSATMVGILNRDTTQNRTIIYSTILGYWIAVICRLILINVFPIRTNSFGQEVPLLPVDPYDVAQGILTLDGVYTYHTFILLTLVLAPILIVIATLTGYWLGMLLRQEMAKASTPYSLPERLETEPNLISVAFFLPLSFLFFIFGFFSLLTFDGGDILISKIEIVFNPASNMFVTALAGAIIGLSIPADKIQAQQVKTLVSAGVGAMIYTLIIIMMQQWFVSMATATSPDYINPLNLLLPNVVFFELLWLMPTLMMVSSVALMMYLRQPLNTPAPSKPFS
jgi:hypothetical protein